MRKVIFPLLIVLILAAVTIIVIAWGRGYQFSLAKKTIDSTGLLVASSDPAGAEIFIDGKLASATNTTLSLAPGWYRVRIVKEGYLPWEKRLRLRGEIVTETQAFLFPGAPSLTPLTVSGAVAPAVSPEGAKIAYAVPFPSAKAGLWVLNLNLNPLGLSRSPVLLASSTGSLDFANGNFTWSPDSTQILAQIGSASYLLAADKQNPPLFQDLNALAQLKASWQIQFQDREEARIAVLPTGFAKLAAESAKNLSFSPDETKVLYEATASAQLPPFLDHPPVAVNPTPEQRTIKPSQIYVYDIKEDKNYLLTSNFPLPTSSLSWFLTSRHLVVAESDKISMMEYDGSNKATIYSGPFEKFVASLPGAKTILILASYNRSAGAANNSPNLYLINLR